MLRLTCVWHDKHQSIHQRSNHQQEGCTGFAIFGGIDLCLRPPSSLAPYIRILICKWRIHNGPDLIMKVEMKTIAIPGAHMHAWSLLIALVRSL